MERSSDRAMDSLWTIKELCEFLKVSESVVRYWMRMKMLPHIKLGKQTRFDPVDIRRWLSAHKSVSYDDDAHAKLKRIS